MISEADSVAKPSSIPEAEFIDDVDKFMEVSGSGSPEAALRRLDEMLQKYRYMESSLFQKKSRVKRQVPDLRDSLELVEHLEKKKADNETVQANFTLSSQCSSLASIPPTDTVCLWLGANVMLEYSLEEAKTLLRDNLEMAEKNINKITGDLEFLRDQITTSEVNMARVYNWDVQRRKAAGIPPMGAKGAAPGAGGNN